MSGETPDVKTRDRFDLEQEILECWKVVNDIQMLTERNASADQFAVLAQYYELKFDRLWDTFEQLTHQRRIA